jgi:acyl-coenzyme A thioesterase PaaI-like protein
VVHRGRSTATTEGRAWVESSGKLLAHGTGSCLIREA